MKKLHGPFTQLLPLRNLPRKGPISDDQLEIITDGGLLEKNGKVIAVGKWQELRSEADQLKEVEGDSVALPGFIDCHTHLCWAGNRAGDYAKRLGGATYQEIAKGGGGILDTVRQTRKASQSELQELIERRAARLYASGIRTAEVKSGYGLTIEDELKMLRAINEAKTELDLIPTCLAAHVVPPEFKNAKSYLEEVMERLLPLVKKENLASRIDIFVEEGAFSVEVAKPYLMHAKELGFTITIHADQFSSGGARLAAEVGAASADHLEASEEKDLIALAKSKTIPVVLPGASLGLGLPFAPARAALDAGLPLAIASDWNPGSAPHGGLLVQAALLGANQKLTMAETLAGITVQAAAALQLSDRGSLEKGLRADFVQFSTRDYRNILYYQGSLQPEFEN